MNINEIYLQIERHPSNSWAKKLGYKPVYTASKEAKIVIIGQAPGRKAQESGIPWDDVSGNRLRHWLGVSKDTFYDDTKIALVPMDFYYPGKGKSGDLPPRKDFAPMWHNKILQQMPKIELTILVGQFAQKYYLEKNMGKNLTETVYNYKDYLPEIFPLVHPSPLNIRWLSKNQWFEEKIIPVLQSRVEKILSE